MREPVVTSSVSPGGTPDSQNGGRVDAERESIVSTIQ